MADPVSWLMIQPGWQVCAADGSELGKVGEVTGAPDEDIFDGLTIARNVLDKPTYVPAENVGVITEGRVELTISAEQVAALDESPPGER